MDDQGGHFLDRDKLNGLYDEVYELAREKLGTDSDGDLPVDIIIVDRTRYERIQYLHVPYDHKVKTAEEWDDMVGALMTNLAIAADQLNRWHRCSKYHPRPKVLSATDRHLAEENRTLAERNKTLEGELNVMRREHAVQIRKDEAVKSARTKRDEAVDALNHLWDCREEGCEVCEDYKKRFRLDDKKQ